MFKEEMENINLQEIEEQVFFINELYDKVEGNRINELNNIIDTHLKELEKNYNMFKNYFPSWKNIKEQIIKTSSQTMENIVKSTLLNYEYKEDGINNKITSSNLYYRVNVLPK